MPKATQMPVCEKHNLLNEESEVPSNSEEAASSDQEIDQEPDPEVTFYPLGHNKQFQTCSCHT